METCAMIHFLELHGCHQGCELVQFFVQVRVQGNLFIKFEFKFENNYRY